MPRGPSRRSKGTWDRHVKKQRIAATKREFV
jgi:hypothetical protein